MLTFTSFVTGLIISINNKYIYIYIYIYIIDTTTWHTVIAVDDVINITVITAVVVVVVVDDDTFISSSYCTAYYVYNHYSPMADQWIHPWL